MTDLHLALKREYFEQIRDGSKTEEYRLRNEYWRKRLEWMGFDRIILTLARLHHQNHHAPALWA